MAFKFNVFTGKFDLVEINEPNFSYTYVDPDQSIDVPFGQEMLVSKDVLVDGDLLINGDMLQLPDIQQQASSEFSFFFTKIISSESIVIPENRLLLFANNLMVDGNLLVNGELTDAFFGVYF